MKTTLDEALRGLSSEDMQELVDFAYFLRNRAHGKNAGVCDVRLHHLPASTLSELTAALSLGGDAVRDSETIYDGELSGSP